jgi:ribosomal protein S18 acetylase RimI-like enzyme
MIEIRPLTHIMLDDLERIANGYVSDLKYEVIHKNVDGVITFTLRPKMVESPYVKKFAFNQESLDQYRHFVSHPFSFGAYDDERLVAIAISEPLLWNNSLRVHEFHVAEIYRGRGIGRLLMSQVAEAARAAGFRIIVCETQNTNGVAIKIYERLGFTLQGLDLTNYRNTDYPDGEIAVFMKLRLA